MNEELWEKNSELEDEIRGARYFIRSLYKEIDRQKTINKNLYYRAEAAEETKKRLNAKIKKLTK